MVSRDGSLVKRRYHNTNNVCIVVDLPSYVITFQERGSKRQGLIHAMRPSYREVTRKHLMKIFPSLPQLAVRIKGYGDEGFHRDQKIYEQLSDGNNFIGNEAKEDYTLFFFNKVV
ncbi:hypothetical protein TNCV_4260881 [Trichonephila clavipes]|nr:hypothetical protein TNCV_4260881 [Trichonephila clavipes]